MCPIFANPVDWLNPLSNGVKTHLYKLKTSPKLRPDRRGLKFLGKNDPSERGGEGMIEMQNIYPCLLYSKNRHNYCYLLGLAPKSAPRMLGWICSEIIAEINIGIILNIIRIRSLTGGLLSYLTFLSAHLGPIFEMTFSLTWPSLRCVQA